MTNAADDVVREVTAHVEEALRKNRQIETVLIILLVILALVGLGLLITGAIRQQLALALPGGLCELAVGWPIQTLVKLRQENIRLAILPQLIRLAEPSDRKRLVFKLIERLVHQLGP